MLKITHFDFIDILFYLYKMFLKFLFLINLAMNDIDSYLINSSFYR